jgi:hypothetical protein
VSRLCTYILERKDWFDVRCFRSDDLESLNVISANKFPISYSVDVLHYLYTKCVIETVWVIEGC